MKNNFVMKAVVFGIVLLFVWENMIFKNDLSLPFITNGDELKKTLILGKYENLTAEGEYINLDAINIILIKFKPYRLLHYNSGEKITYLKETKKTLITPQFIIGFADIKLSDERIKKMTSAYGTTMKNQANRQYVAEHFDLLDLNRWDATIYGDEIKDYNPNIKIIGYNDLIWTAEYLPEWLDFQEDWFCHDIYGSTIDHRIWRMEGSDKIYYMNPKPSVGWRDYFIYKMNLGFIQNTPIADGIFHDDTVYCMGLNHPDIPQKNMHSDYGDNILGRILTYNDWDQDLLTNWPIYMTAIIQDVQTALTNYNSNRDMVMENAERFTKYCKNITHVHHWEGFIHARWDSSTEQGGYSGPSWDYGVVLINSLHQQAVLGNIIATSSGCTIDSPDNERVKWLKYTLGCFLLTVGTDISKAYYSWMGFGSETTGSIINGYHPIMDTNFGQPVQNYIGDIEDSSLQIYEHPWTHHYYGGVFLREFQNYWVIVNICPSSNLYDYSGILPDGQSYTVHSKEALFIAK